MAGLFFGLSADFAALVREACPGIMDEDTFHNSAARDYDFAEIYAGWCRLTGQLQEAPFLHKA